MPLCDCTSYDAKFDAASAAKQLADYQANGPNGHTQTFLDCLLDSEIPKDAMLLDVGGGIGVLGHQLIGRGVTDVALVEASAPFVEVARGAAEDLRVVTRWSFHLGDFVALEDELPMADLVTLHRVICCYPDYENMLRVVVARCRGLIAISYPHDRFYERWAAAIANLYYRMCGTEFRTFVHPPEAMHAILENAGFELVSACDDWLWATRVYSAKK